MKVYGPYAMENGRLYVTIRYDDGVQRTVSYPKFLVEQQLGRRLGDDETVDHIDRNFHNNDSENLQVLDRNTHARLDALRLSPVTFSCPICKKNFRRSGKKLRRIYERKREGHAGPFCSHKCAGVYSAEVREGFRFRLIETYDEFLERYPKSYYRREKHVPVR